MSEPAIPPELYQLALAGVRWDVEVHVRRRKAERGELAQRAYIDAVQEQANVERRIRQLVLSTANTIIESEESGGTVP